MKSGLKSRRHVTVAVLGDVLLEGGATWLRSHRFGGNLVVRCRQGHLFTTLWIPAVSLTSLRFGWWRFQYCPVGQHWSVVVPVRQDELSRKQRRAARSRRDVPLP
jgi:hypothetical protein